MSGIRRGLLASVATGKQLVSRHSVQTEGDWQGSCCTSHLIIERSSIYCNSYAAPGALSRFSLMVACQ